MIMRTRYKNFLGHGQIHSDESNLAKSWSKFFFKARMGILLFLLFQWYLELKDSLTPLESTIANIIVISFFSIEFFKLASLVTDKKRYIIRNWTLPLIIFTLIIFLFFSTFINEHVIDGIRLILIFWLIIPWLEICLNSLCDNQLTTTIFVAIFVIIFSGIIISGLDESIGNPWDGIWWAWVTMTTVGYGDIVPESVIGRALAFPLIFTGLFLFAAFTANFSALFVKHKLKKNLANIKKEEVEIQEMIKTIKTLNSNIKKLSNRISSIEDKFEE